MNNLIKTCLTLSFFSLGLSGPVIAKDLVTDTLYDTGQVVHTALFGWGDWHPDYLLEDMSTGATMRLDGLDEGVKVDDPYYITKNYRPFYGDKLTNLNTGKSGIIKGVKDQGTMDVMSPRGNWVRYEYVVFKVKPVK